MKISSLSPINYKSKIIFRLPLKTGETAKITVNDNKCNIKDIGYEIWNKGKITETKFYSAREGLNDNSLSNIIEEIDKRAAQGYDFFSEFTTACLRKQN